MSSVPSPFGGGVGGGGGGGGGGCPAGSSANVDMMDGSPALEMFEERPPVEMFEDRPARFFLYVSRTELMNESRVCVYQCWRVVCRCDVCVPCVYVCVVCVCKCPV